MRLLIWPTESVCSRHPARLVRTLIGTIERNIVESDEATRLENLGRMWVAGVKRSAPWTQEDIEVYDALLTEYRSDAHTGRKK